MSSDPLPFTLLAEEPTICRKACFIDIDYEKLMKQKCEIVRSTYQLRKVIGEEQSDLTHNSVIFRTDSYVAVACDLSDEKSLKAIMTTLQLENSSILFVAEVSMTYMEIDAADSVIKMASSFPDSKFCLLEQWMPDGPEHPFVSTMLQHFDKLHSPLKSPLAYQNAQSQRQRFRRNGWPIVQVQSLWSLWGDNKFISSAERRDLDLIEPFDEWEEFALFGCHYFLLTAMNSTRDLGSSSALEGQAPIPTHYIRTVFSPYRYTHELHRHSAGFRRSHDIICHGGQGTQGRLSNSFLYSIENEAGLIERGAEKASAFRMPRLERIFHTICKIGNAGVLIAGGRKSPENASKLCFWGSHNVWNNAPNLPEEIFRHCAVAISLKANVSAALIFGGKNSTGRVLGSWLYWVPGCVEWQELAIEGTGPCDRFAASMSVNEIHGFQGHLAGGLRSDGTVLSDLWKWELLFSEDRVSVKCTDMTSKITQEQHGSASFGRFGASLLERGPCLYIVGGVGASTLVSHSESIIEIDAQMKTKSFALETAGPRAILIGHSCELTGDERSLCNIAIAGGGCTCFSFGSFWNKGTYSVVVSGQSTKVQPWTVIPGDNVDNFSQHIPAKLTQGRLLSGTNGSNPVNGTVTNERSEISVSDFSTGTERQIERLRLSDEAVTFKAIVRASYPAILESLDLGRCTTSWDLEYLKDKIGADRKVVVHSSSFANMDFLTKNFEYQTKTFEDFTKAVEAGEHVYLRSISSDKPTEKATRLENDFAEISDDFSLPQELQYAVTNLHSSPLRISGPVNMWLHYDVLCNLYCQIRGSKRLVLFNPSTVDKLQFPHGASSSSLRIFDEQGKVRPEITPLGPYVCDLAAGQVLFIPALWPHAAHPIQSPSIAVNVFFRNLERGYAAGKDVYGNRDIQAYESGRRDIARLQRAFQGLPADFQQFYLKRLAAEISEAATAGDPGDA